MAMQCVCVQCAFTISQRAAQSSRTFALLTAIGCLPHSQTLDLGSAQTLDFGKLCRFHFGAYHKHLHTARMLFVCKTRANDCNFMRTAEVSEVVARWS